MIKTDTFDQKSCYEKNELVWISGRRNRTYNLAERGEGMALISGKYLTFSLGDEEYGIPIGKIKEIIGILEITAIPKAPHFIKGVINLRGKIIPVVDLRLKFGMEEMVYNERSCTIVVETIFEEEKKLTGVIVDTVSEVVNVQKDDMEELPKYSGDKTNSCFNGIGKVKGKVILLLDVETVIDSDEINMIDTLNIKG